MILEIKNFLSKGECELLIDRYDTVVEPVNTGERLDSRGYAITQDIRDSHRKTDLCVFSDDGLRNRILNKLVDNSNCKLSNIDKQESFQFLRYKETGHFAWHNDLTSRKEYMTAIIFLNNNYDGGNLQYKENEEIKTFSKEKGSLVLFPASLSHKVSKITKGVRYSIVTWIYNKPNILI